MNKRITVKLRLSPLAWQVIKKECERGWFAYDISKTYLYDIVKSQLTKKQQPPLEPDDEKHLTDSVFITMRDFELYGCEIRHESHALISHIIERTARREINTFIATAVACGIKRDTAIKQYLFENDIDEQLTFHAAKKYYQRNCKEMEEEMKSLIDEIKKSESRKIKPDVNF